MPHESTVDHDGSELSADDEADSPAAIAMEISSTNYLHSLIAPTKVPHLPHVRPETPKEVTHHHDDDEDDDDDDDNDVEVDNVDVADENVNGSITNQL